MIGPVVEAARAALRPPGAMPWIADARTDRVELRTVNRRWSTAVEPSARLARVVGGTALRAARLAVAAQGRRPLVSYPDTPGVLAVLHAGVVVAPRPEELLLYAMLWRAEDPAPDRGGAADGTAVVRRLRRAAEAEGAWLRLLPEPAIPSSALGPGWRSPGDGPAIEPDPQSLVAVIGAPGPVPAADLRAGQAVETVRLTALADGLDLQVLAAPATPMTPALTRCVGRTTDTLAIVQIRRAERRRTAPAAEECDPGDRRAR